MKMKGLLGAIFGLGLLIGLSGPASATLLPPIFTTFDQASCTAAGGFYSEMTAANTDLNGFGQGPYGAICVLDTTAGAVTINAETFGIYEMVDGGALALNFAGTGGTTAGAFSFTGVSWSPSAGPCSSGGAGNEDGFGNMNFSINCQGAAGDPMTQIQVTGTDTITAAASVLTFNAKGFDAGMHIFVPNCGSGSCTGFAAENMTGTRQVIAEPQSLALLGIGLIGAGFIRRRRAS
jgi:hypothetical protein